LGSVPIINPGTEDFVLTEEVFNRFVANANGDFSLAASRLARYNDLSIFHATRLIDRMRRDPGAKAVSLSKKREEFRIPFIRQALYHELDSAQEQGLGAVMIAIKPHATEALGRSESVQRTY